MLVVLYCIVYGHVRPLPWKLWISQWQLYVMHVDISHTRFYWTGRFRCFNMLYTLSRDLGYGQINVNRPRDTFGTPRSHLLLVTKPSRLGTQASHRHDHRNETVYILTVVHRRTANPPIHRLRRHDLSCRFRASWANKQYDSASSARLIPTSGQHSLRRARLLPQRLRCRTAIRLSHRR